MFHTPQVRSYCGPRTLCKIRFQLGLLSHYRLSPHTLPIPVIPVELIDTEIDRFPITETTCICSHMYCIEAKNTPVERAGDAVVTSSFGLMFPARGRGTCSL